MKPLLKALIVRHSIVATKIAEEQKRPLPDGLRVRSLKKIKLRLKEQIALLQKNEPAFATPASSASHLPRR